MSEPCHYEESHGGRVVTLTLDAGRGNVLDRSVLDALIAHTKTLQSGPPRAAVVMKATGEHFSYGASIQEHRLDEIGPALERHTALGLIERRDGRVRLTERGLLLSNEVFIDLLPDPPETDDASPRMSGD